MRTDDDIATIDSTLTVDNEVPLAIFICPMIGTGTREDPWRPKYQRGADVARANSIRLGSRDVALLMIDATDTYLATIRSDAECTQIATPANIDSVLNASQVNNISTFLENRGIPADWLTAGETRRQAIRGVAGIFLFAQRCEGLFGMGLKAKMVERGVTLDTQWQNFPQALQDEFVGVLDSHGWNYAQMGLTRTTTIRELLRICGNKFQNTPISMAGVSL